MSFFLWPGFNEFFESSWWFHDDFGQKSWNQSGFMKCKIKINWNHLATRLGSRAGVEREALRSGPRAQPVARKVSIYFFTEFHEYHLWFSNFVAKNFREYHPKWPNNTWNPGHKIKKICAVYIEILLWWYFGQEYSLCIFRFITDLIMTWHYFLGFEAVYSLFIFRSIADLTMTWHCFWGFKGLFSFVLQIWQKRNKKKV